MEETQLKWLTKELVQKDKTRRKRSEEEYRKFEYAVSYIADRALLACVPSRLGTTRISKDRNRYTQNRYNDKDLAFRPAIEQAFPLMVEGNFITVERNGSYDRDTRRGKQTEIRATEKLISFVGDDLKYTPCRLARKPIPEVIRVHGPDKRPIDYTDDERTREWRDNLRLINECVVRSWADLNLTNHEWSLVQEELKSDPKHDYRPIDLSRQQLVRIFNSTKFNEGGRFYWGWWQNIPSRFRSCIHINGKQTVELDYRQLNPTILYALAGVSLHGDAYEVGLGPDHRDLVKQAFNAMVQSSRVLTRPPRGLEFPKNSCVTWRDLVTRIQAKHSPISDMFFKGLGMKLQFEDSCVAEKVMLHFAKIGAAILPIHDSFICHWGYQQELEDVMCDAFEEQFGVKARIKLEEKKYLEVSIKPLGEIFEDISFDRIVGGGNPYWDVMMRSHWHPEKG
jgi:hypothetical protein